MKKTLNSIVFFFASICTVISIKLSTVPLLPFFTEDSFWYTSSVVRDRFSLVYDLCVGFLLSAVFYFLVDVLPEKSKVYRGKLLIQKHINSLLAEMEKLLSICFQVYNIDQKMGIHLKNLSALCGNTRYADRDISFHITTYSFLGNKKSGLHTAGTFNNVIKSCIAEIEKTLREINRYSFFYASCEDFLEIIICIEACRLISEYRKKSEEDVVCFKYADADKALYDFYLLYQRLQKAKFHTEYTSTLLDSPESCSKYKKQRESGELLAKAIAYQKQRVLAYEQERPVLLYKETNDTRNIIERIQKEIPFLTTLCTDTNNPLSLQQYQLIIVLDRANFPLNSINSEQAVFWFRESLLPKSLFQIKSKNNNGRQIHYKKPFSIFSRQINAEHPTNSDINMLTTSIDTYVREKYSLTLDLSSD